uniref:Uncharacterized protein n=1 Tax=Arundo donax TaxID=35708 RepID=A0A0A8ZX69_ARUDO
MLRDRGSEPCYTKVRVPLLSSVNRSRPDMQSLLHMNASSSDWFMPYAIGDHTFEGGHLLLRPTIIALNSFWISASQQFGSTDGLVNFLGMISRWNSSRVYRIQ